MVASATYLNVNPAVDVPVQVRPAPEEELARQRMFRQRWCFHRAPLLYGLWGLLSWLVACGVALPRRLGVGRWGTAAVGGLLAYALLPALLALPDLWRAHPMSQAPFDQWLLPARFWLLVPFILFDGPGLWLFCMVSPLLPMSLCYFALSACRAGRLRTVIVLTLLAGTLYLLGGGLILYGMLRI
jgi:hypothetical protein